jgi:hypothetical protein
MMTTVGKILETKQEMSKELASVIDSTDKVIAYFEPFAKANKKAKTLKPARKAATA